MGNNFTKQKNVGSLAEKLVMNYLTLAGIDTIPNTDKESRSYYDLEFKLGSKRVTCEVKLDFLASKTGNMAIEIKNTKTGKDSGLSITTATLWTVCIRDFENWAIFVVSVNSLKNYIKNHRGIRKEGVGDGNSTILLYKCDDILKIFSRLDNIAPENIAKVLKTVLKS